MRILRRLVNVYYLSFRYFFDGDSSHTRSSGYVPFIVSSYTQFCHGYVVSFCWRFLRTVAHIQNPPRNDRRRTKHDSYDKLFRKTNVLRFREHTFVSIDVDEILDSLNFSWVCRTKSYGVSVSIPFFLRSQCVDSRSFWITWILYPVDNYPAKSCRSLSSVSNAEFILMYQLIDTDIFLISYNNCLTIRPSYMITSELSM